MRALLKAAASRPLFCFATGVILGLAPRRDLAGPFPALFLVFAFLLIIAAWRELNLRRDGRAALMLLAAGLALGAWRVRPLVGLLQAPPASSIAALRAEGRVTQDLGEREESGRRACVLTDVRVWNLGEGSGPQDWEGSLRLSYEPVEGMAVPGPGDRVAFIGSLHAPEPPTNPGEFDYRSYLIGRGIRGMAHCRRGSIPIILTPAAPSPLRLAWLAKERMAAGLKRALSPRAADLARGMVLGDTGGLSARDMSVYSRTGLVHILSVSGLHLALFIALFLWGAAALGLRRRPRAWIGLALAVAYAFICGLPVPAVRALLLFSLVLLAQALDLDSDMPTSLAFGAVLILLIQPGALFEAGAQLSFAVSFSLMALTPLLEGRLESLPKPLRLAAAGSLAAEAAAVPLVAWHFSMFSWPSLFATALTAPLMGPIIGLGLATALTGWALVAVPLEWLLQILDWITARMAELPWAAYSTGRPPSVWLATWLALLLLGAAGMLKGWRLSAATVAMAAWLLWPGMAWAHRHSGLTKAWFLDVGQGDATLVEFGDGKVLLVDGGPNLPNAGNWVVGPALRRLGLNRLDWVVVTHPHADHYGGLLWVLDQFKVSQLLHSGEAAGPGWWNQLLQTAAAKGVPVLDLGRFPAPEDWMGRVETLGPLSPRLEGTKKDMHNNGVVLRVEGWMLLSGDLEAEGEARLGKLGLLKPCALVKAGHHGSKTSSTAAFLGAQRPQAVVVSCGRRNRYSHPSKFALARLRAAQCDLYRTDLQGCVKVLHGPLGLSLMPWRQAAPKALWTAPRRARRSLWKYLEKQGRLAGFEPGRHGFAAPEFGE